MRAFIVSLAVLTLAACAPTAAAPDASPIPSGKASLGQSCGGMVIGSAQTCSGANEYCHRDIKDMCGAADAPGTCRTKPEMCTMEYAPVCGCDGITYSNECAANAKGISAASQGECP